LVEPASAATLKEVSHSQGRDRNLGKYRAALHCRGRGMKPSSPTCTPRR
jgi:hypothetical protein